MTGSAFHDRAHAVFRELVAAPEPERADLLRSLCVNDEELRREVESLLRADAEAGGFMGSTVPDALASSLPGARLGAYQLDEVIGEGGMGLVYRAHRADGAYEQQVVVKLIRGGTLDRDLVRRFDRERRVLAALRHPNIARLLDGGVSEGRPYLVMELVRGDDILSHCDTHRLAVRERLELFDAACAAVQHAHANLIVHRDLKPAHIIIDEHASPKLLDFGIAAMLDDEQPGAPTITARRRFTPQYASPEQIRGEPITTATDVYSLGLILYELLGGRRPYAVETGLSDADRRSICETSPPAPSRLLSTTANADAAEIASARGVPVSRLRRLLTGDLDTIVMTALQKDPARRYPSVEALRDDLRRHREGLPIAARPDSWSYRASRFVRRHRWGVGAAALIAALLLAGVGATAWQANIAESRRRDAETALATSDTVGRFLRSILVAADPREQGQDVTLRDAIDRAAGRIEDELAGSPLVEARVREAIGSTYRTLGAQDEAEPQLERAVELVGKSDRITPAERSRIEHELAILRLDQGRFEEASELFALAYQERLEHLGADHPDTLESRETLGLALEQLGRHEEAYGHISGVIEARERVLGPAHPETLVAKNDLVPILLTMQRNEEALELIREVYDAQVDVIGADHPDTLISANDIGTVLTRMGRIEEAIPWQRRALEGLERQFPAGSMDVVIPRMNIARALIRLERYDEAIEPARRAIEDGAPTLGDDHYVIAVARTTLGKALLGVGRLDEAREPLERSHRDLLAALGPDNPFTKDAEAALADLDAAEPDNDDP